MWKAAVVAAGVFALAGTTILMAQDRGPEGHRWMGPGMAQGDPDGPRWGGGPGWHRWSGRGEGERHRLSADDMRAFADARIAALHAGLALRPDQEKNWPPFEQALRAAAKDRIDRVQARKAAGDATARERSGRAAQARGRRHEPPRRRAQADRRHGRAALSEPRRRAEEPVPHVGSFRPSSSRLAALLRAARRRRQSLSASPTRIRHRPRRRAIQ